MTASTSYAAALEQGHPSTDPRAFRRSLGQFATGVTVMTTQHEGQQVGMSVNSFAALSLDPALVLWSIRKESQSLNAFLKSGHYAVNVLSEQQVELSNLFAKPGEDRFAHVNWRPGQFGAPLLNDSICTFECKLHQVLEGGDHFILVGRVEQYAVYPGKPLLFTQGRYGVTAEMASPTSSDVGGAAPTSDAEWLKEATLLRKFHLGSQLLSSRFDEVRTQTGQRVAEFRIYGWLRSSDMPEAELRKRLYAGDAEMQDALNSLQQRGHLTRTADGLLQLTPDGKTCSDNNGALVASFESQMFAGVSPEDLLTTHRVLSALIAQAEKGSLR